MKKDAPNTLADFRKWCKLTNNYSAAEALDRYLEYLKEKDELE